MSKDQPHIFVSMPAGGEQQTIGAARGFWNATRRREEATWQLRGGSLLALNFNHLWCGALNMAAAGANIQWFGMQHADIEPEAFWMDTLIEEAEEHDLDVLGVVSPIKNMKGLTSLAMAREDGDPWRVKCRLTMRELFRLPPTFTSEDIGGQLLLNTGLWVCRFDPTWASQVHFEIRDRIVMDPQGRYCPETEPEDWSFSRQCHELGLRVGATRKVRLDHTGTHKYPNHQVWGQSFDADYVDASQVRSSDTDGHPWDVEGWLSQREGEALTDLAAGKRVLEVGSYCGRSTICLARSARSVCAVDTWDGRGTPAPQSTLEAFRTNLDRYGVKAVTYRRDEFEQLANPEPFDVVFIDGDHSAEAVQEDIDLATRHLKPEGLVVFHDYRTEPGQCDGRWDAGVTEAVDQFLADGAELLERHDTLAVVRPPAREPMNL